MPVLRLRGAPPQDPALLCHPDVVRDHTTRIMAMEKSLMEVAQGQRELLESVRALLGKVDRQTAAAERLASHWALGDGGLQMRQPGMRADVPDDKKSDAPKRK